jgi:hypothetical protein
MNVLMRHAGLASSNLARMMSLLLSSAHRHAMASPNPEDAPVMSERRHAGMQLKEAESQTWNKLTKDLTSDENNLVCNTVGAVKLGSHRAIG